MNNKELIEQKLAEIEDEMVQEKKFHFWTMAEILAYDFGKTEWVIEKLLPAPAITVLSGESTVGKTWLTLEMGRCVALGLPFLDRFQTTQGAVLMVNEEDYLGHLRKRFTSLQFAPEAPIYYLSQSNARIDEKDDLKKLLAFTAENAIKLIVFDSLVRIHSQMENESHGIARVFASFREFTKTGVSVLVTHHHRKEGVVPGKLSSQLRGSSDILNATDCHIAAKKNGNEILLYQNKLRVAEPFKPFCIETTYSSEGSSSLRYVGDIKEGESKKETAKVIILEILKEREHTTEELKQKVKSVESVGTNSIGEALHELHEAGEVIIKVGKHNQKFFSLPLEQFE